MTDFTLIHEYPCPSVYKMSFKSAFICAQDGIMSAMRQPTRTAANALSPDTAAWDAFVEAHPAAHLLQLSGWGALKGGFGWEAERVALASDGSIVAGAQLLFQRKYGLGLGYVPRGPLVDWQNGDQVRGLIAALTEECRRRGAAVLKLEPELPDTPANRALLASYGLHLSPQTIQPRSTILVDLRRGEEGVLARMKSKWRYNVRLAEKKGVSVRECSAADLPVFHALMRETAARDRFDVHDPAYYDAAFRLLVPRHAAFLLAEYEGTPLAAIVVCGVGPLAWYLWGASGARERNRMPNHALQWAGMRWAMARGAHFYDLWGIPDELGALAQALNRGDGSGLPSDELALDLDNLPESGGLWGVYRFKQGFGGDVVRSVGAWDLPVNQLGHAVYSVGLKALEFRRSYASAGATGQNPHVVTDRAQWNDVLAKVPDPHVLQSWEWGEVKAQTGWQAERFRHFDGRIAFQLLTRRPIPRLPLSVGYVPKGPLLDWKNPGLVEAAVQAVEEAARRKGCILVKIDPDVAEESAAGRRLTTLLRARGWLFSREQVQYKNTAVSDLTADAESLLEGMKSKWRYNVRLAERRGISVRIGGADDLAAFYALYAETGARDGFLIRPFDYYRTTWQTFLRAQATPGSPIGGALLLAEHPEENEPLAGLFLMRSFVSAWYFYGASSERRRRDMPNYLLQWSALQWAREQGCTRYDWWGAPTHPEDDNDPMQGVWSFKQGFGAQLAVNVGAWDFPVQPLLYRAYVEALPRVMDLLRRRGRTA